MAPSATSAADKGFTGDGAVVFYLDNKGDNRETYGNGNHWSLLELARSDFITPV
jgi:hypothetical protein